MMPRFQRDSSKDSFRHQSQNYPTEHYLLYWEADSLQMLYAFATKTQQKRIETSLGDIYQRPKTHIDDLRETTERRDFGKLFLSKITKNVANACFGEPCVSKLNGCRAKLEHAYDFTTPADRITLFLKELLQSPTLRTFETIGFIPLCNEANSVLNKICEHDTKEEDANKYRYSEHISANLLPT